MKIVVFVVSFIFFTLAYAQIEMHAAPQGSRRVKDDIKEDNRLPRLENEWGNF